VAADGALTMAKAETKTVDRSPDSGLKGVTPAVRKTL
jgi:hypothetical protein